MLLLGALREYGRMTRTVGVVVPAYRPDPGALTTYVDALVDEFDPETIRIELDAPDDAVLAALSDCPATVNAVEERRGKGAAITAGFEALETDVRLFVDADGSTPAASVASVLAPVLDGRADLAVGSRRHPDADVRSHQTLARKHLGDGFAWLARRLLAVPLYDYQCGAKAIDRDAWADVRAHLYEPGFAWDIELVTTVDALGYRIEEVPVAWTDDPRSTVSPVGTPVELGLSLLRSRHRAKRLRGNRVHTAIASRGRKQIALVDRIASETRDE